MNNALRGEGVTLSFYDAIISHMYRIQWFLNKSGLLLSLILLLFIVPATIGFREKPAGLFNIPEQTINLYKLIGNNSKNTPYTINSFQISELVTLKEYKAYLSAVKKDSTQEFYRSQLPDSGIGPKEIRDKYMMDKIYEDYPVLGISWDNAMNFCKWKTRTENKDSIRHIYRLPNCSEWLAAYYCLTGNKATHDLNKNYSDWLINTKDEGGYDFSNGDKPKRFSYDYIYFHSAKDPAVLKRKQVIGDSYLYQQSHIMQYSFSYYANEGYRHVGFRYVKEPVDRSPEIRKGKSLAQTLIEEWRLRNK